MKKIISCVLFCALALCLSLPLTDFLTPKAQNRYFILEKYLEEHPEQYEHDVQVFGSCHSYTSFNSIYLEERTGVSAFVFGNAGEIVPTTYVRMVEQFKKHIPKVALVEIWGINPYETYSDPEDVFGDYLANNLERTKLSLEKLEVIRDFKTIEGLEDIDTVDYASMLFPFITYKDRLMNQTLNETDFDYTFEGTEPYSTNFMFTEMYLRLSHNGFKPYASNRIEDYPQKQNYINDGEFMRIEPDIVKYIQKIIDLCKKNDVELIFYRTPYRSTVNELKKLNHLQQICDENDVLFVDLESELSYNFTTDFYDYEHLSEVGANRSTEFLIPYILERLKDDGIDYKNPAEEMPVNLLTNSDFTKLKDTGDSLPSQGAGYTVDNWYTDPSSDNIQVTSEGLQFTKLTTTKSWRLYQTIENAESFVGKSLTAVFHIADFEGTQVRPTISFRDADDKEILEATAIMADGLMPVSCVIPEGTQSIRVGFYGYDGAKIGDAFTVKSIEFYEGAYVIETLPGGQ